MAEKGKEGKQGPQPGSKPAKGRAPVPSETLSTMTLDEEFEEVEFFLQQGMQEDGMNALREIAKRHGPKVTTNERFKELRNRAKGSAAQNGSSQAKEKPKAEEPKAEEPKAEEPKAEEPKAEEKPKAEEPKAEEPKAEEPKAEEPKAEEPKPEEPKAEEKPKAEEPKPEEKPKAEEPKPEEPKASAEAEDAKGNAQAATAPAPAKAPVTLPPLGSRVGASGPVKLTPPPKVDTSKAVDPTTPLGERLALLKAKAQGPLSAAKAAAGAAPKPGLTTGDASAVPKAKLGAPGSGSASAAVKSPATGAPKGPGVPEGKKDSPLFRNRSTDPKGIRGSGSGPMGAAGASGPVITGAASPKGSEPDGSEEAAPLPPPPAEVFGEGIPGVELPPLGGDAKAELSAVSPADKGLPVVEVGTGEDEEEEEAEEPTREVSPSVPPLPGLALPALGVATALPVAGRAPPTAVTSPVSPAPSAPSAPSASLAPPAPPAAAGVGVPATAASPFDDLHVELTEPIERQEGEPKRRIWIYGGVAAGAVALLVILIVALSGSGKKGDGAKPSDKTASARTVPDAQVPKPDAAPARVAARDAAVASDAAAPARPAMPDAAAPSTVKLTLTVEPAEASPTISFRGQEHRGRRLEKEGLEASTKPEVVRVMAPGFETVSLTLTLDRSVQQTVKLKPRAQARPGDPERRVTRRRPPRVRPRSMLIDLD